MKVLSIDIGASSGRFIVTSHVDGVFSYEETYRFPNGAIERDGHLYWDIDEIIRHIKEGLKISLTAHRDIQSVGVDTWGVDYVLIKDGKKVADPFAYRDIRNEETMKQYVRSQSYKDIYNETGIQRLPFNTVFQLLDDVRRGVEFDSFLMIPDYINYVLSGKQFIELTNLSTGALYNPETRSISSSILKHIGLDEDKVPEIIYPSMFVGTIKKEIIDELGIYEIPVVTTGSHDTASAVASISLSNNSAYLSSGTWSLLGIELDEPLISEESYKLNFTNEIGLNHSIRFLKNIMGLFIVQELKKDLEKINPGLSFQQMQDEASKIEDNEIYIDINDDLFQRPYDMLEKFYAYLKKTNQYTGELSYGKITRIVYESMAMKYLEEIKNLEKLSGKHYDELVVIGGGSNAKCLNQIIADTLGIKVSLGDKEATVVGNVFAQAIYLKEFKSLDEARSEYKKTLNRESYEPKRNLEGKYKKYLEVVR